MDTEYFSDNGDVTIVGIGKDSPGFILANGACLTAEYAQLIDEYKCRSLHFNVMKPNNKVDLTLIKSFDRITQLCFKFNDAGCEIVFPAKKSEKLNSLSLTGKVPHSCDCFDKFPSLRYVEIDDHPKITGWKEHQKIIDLKINYFKNKDLVALTHMKSLRRLTIMNGVIESLQGIEGLKNLETLRAINLKKIRSFVAILQSSSLRNLCFEGSKAITDWEFLKNIPQLECLSFQYIDSIGFISQLPNLRFIFFQKLLDKNEKPANEHPNLQRVRQSNSNEPLPFYKLLI